MKKKLAILYGGWSYESYLCGYQAIINAVNKLNMYEVQSFKCDSKSLIPDLITFAPDVAFLASHGTYHEDGKLQSVLEYLDIPYNGSGVTASAVGMSKIASKLAFIGAGIKCAPYKILNKDDSAHISFNEVQHEFGTPFVIKPVTGGASVGLASIVTEEDYNNKIDVLLNESGSVMIEKC